MPITADEAKIFLKKAGAVYIDKDAPNILCKIINGKVVPKTDWFYKIDEKDAEEIADKVARLSIVFAMHGKRDTVQGEDVEFAAGVLRDFGLLKEERIDTRIAGQTGDLRICPSCKKKSWYPTGTKIGMNYKDVTVAFKCNSCGNTWEERFVAANLA